MLVFRTMKVVNMNSIESEYHKIHGAYPDWRVILHSESDFPVLYTPEYEFGNKEPENIYDKAEYQLLLEIWTILRKAGINDDCVLLDDYI